MYRDDEQEEVEIVYDRIVHQTEMAVLVRTHLGDVWIPKVCWEETAPQRAAIPYNIAREKGLV